MLDDETFLRRFEAADWSADEWHHREHIKIAYLYLLRHPLDAAIAKVRAGVQRLNAAHGVPESPTRGYHETMTQAWMRLVQVTLAEYGPAESADAFFERSPQLAQPKVLRLFYSANLFLSPRAKTEFVEPDLTPLPCSKKVSAKPSEEVPSTGLPIEPMQPADWDQVRRIYLEGLATGQASFETEAPSWEQWNESRLPHPRLVAKDGDRVVAWGALSPVSKRPCYAGVAEASVYVGADARGRGVGKALLTRLIEDSEARGIWMLYGATFAENTASIQLQLACGFRIVGRRERIAQHHGVWRDTIVTERRSQIVGV